MTRKEGQKSRTLSGRWWCGMKQKASFDSCSREVYRMYVPFGSKSKACAGLDFSTYYSVLGKTIKNNY